MMRLVKAGLMFGNLYPVRAGAMVERYNRALRHLTGKETALEEFHVDISGYSPEIGDEFGDLLYLNPNGCNRQFILLSTDQKTAPLLNTQFSTSRSIIRRFIEENEEQLFALTAREAVAGELVNSIFVVSSPRDLFAIREIEIEADTVQSHVKDSQKLNAMITRFTEEPDAWWDDVLIADMIELGKRTGDITRNPVALEHMKFAQGNFYTRHFGGLYVFRDDVEPTVIAADPELDLTDLPVKNALTFKDRSKIAKFLKKNALVEPIVKATGSAATAVLQQKIDFITIHAAADLGLDLTGLDRRQMRGVIRQSLDNMPPEFFGLSDLLRWARDDAPWPRITSEHPAYFYSLRAAQHWHKDLVNMLLADLSRLDFRQLYIFHKDAFYDDYRGWSDTKKDYVVKFLSEEYAIDKAGARAELFGPEPDMENTEPKAPPPRPSSGSRKRKQDDMIDIVGPWGALRTPR